MRKKTKQVYFFPQATHPWQCHVIPPASQQKAGSFISCPSNKLRIHPPLSSQRSDLDKRLTLKQG